jgi:hypothetical protein
MTVSGGDAVTMEMAIIAGDPFPPPGMATEAHRALWGQIAADIAALPAGVIPDVPGDWAR